MDVKNEKYLDWFIKDKDQQTIEMLFLISFMKLMLLKKLILAKGAFDLIIMKVCFGATYVRTFSMHNVREIFHFLNHLPTPATFHTGI
jgi:hypothetical protein